MVIVVVVVVIEVVAKLDTNTWKELVWRTGMEFWDRIEVVLEEDVHEV